MRAKNCVFREKEILSSRISEVEKTKDPNQEV